MDGGWWMVGACPAPAVAILVYIGTPMQRHGYRDISLWTALFMRVSRRLLFLLFLLSLGSFLLDFLEIRYDSYFSLRPLVKTTLCFINRAYDVHHDVFCLSLVS